MLRVLIASLVAIPAVPAIAVAGSELAAKQCLLGAAGKLPNIPGMVVLNASVAEDGANAYTGQIQISLPAMQLAAVYRFRCQIRNDEVVALKLQVVQ